MNIVLAAIDNSVAASPVLHAATAMANTLGIETRALHIIEGLAEPPHAIAAHCGIANIDVATGQDPAAQIIARGSQPDVVMLAVGARSQRFGKRPSGHVALAVITGSGKPVLVVPPDVDLPSDERFHEVLIALEGTASSTNAVAAPLDMLIASGVHVTAVHVFRPEHPPRFWDQASHADQEWATEFLAHWWDRPEVDLHLRTGDVAGSILQVAAAQAVEMIALGWSRCLAADHAKVVQEILGRSRVPVLLTPVEDPPRHPRAALG